MFLDLIENLQARFGKMYIANASTMQGRAALEEL